MTDEEVYNEQTREELVENDEMSATEEGFMEGYGNDSKAECAQCHAPFVEKPVQYDDDGKIKWFCNESCIKKYQTRGE